MSKTEYFVVLTLLAALYVGLAAGYKIGSNTLKLQRRYPHAFAHVHTFN